MCKPEEKETRIVDKYHELKRELKSINHRLGILWLAADQGTTPSNYVMKEIERKRLK